MAEIVQSLFGVTPESYQQAQQQRADAQALQFAQLTPFQQANFAIGRGANMLGGAIGGALGGQDPELQRVTARQQIARQIDLTNPESIQQGMTMLQQAGDTVGLQQLAQVFRQQQESGALVAQRNAAASASVAAAKRDRQAAVPTDIQVANEMATLGETISQLQAAPASPERDRNLRLASGRLSQLERLTAKPGEKGPSFGTDREAVAAEVYDMPFGQLTPTQKAAVNKRVEDENNSKAKAGASKFVLPGDKALVDIPGFRAKVQATIDAPLKTLFAIDNSLPHIEDAIKTDNFASYRAAQTQFARAIAGAGDLSQRELQAAGADPALLGGAADYLSKLATSTPTKDTMLKMKSAMETIKRVNTAKAQNEIDRQRKMAVQSGYPTAALDTALDFGLQTTPGAGGTLAEQAAAELKRRQSKGK
jgi:hypothetical protein